MEADDELSGFWALAREGRYGLQRCVACGALRARPKPACPACLSEAWEWTPASGAGEIWTYTILHRTTPALQAETPFVVATVQLDEAAGRCRVLGRLRGCAPEAAAVGLRVRLCAGAGDTPGFWFELEGAGDA